MCKDLGCPGGMVGCQRHADGWPLAALVGFSGRGGPGEDTQWVGWRLAQGTRQGSTEGGGCCPTCGAVGGVMEHPSTVGVVMGVRRTLAPSLYSELDSFVSP